MKPGALLLALLVLAPAFPTAQAEGSEPKARWHGPTGMMEGWHVRIPLQVHNTLDTPILNGVVSYDLRLADALIEAGWVTSRTGASAKLESWELDPDSVRVIEYRPFSGSAAIDGVPVGEVPSRATTGLYDSTRPYNNRTQPDLHVEWVMPGKTDGNVTRTFFLQVDTLANGRKEPAVYSEPQMAPIEGRGWIGRGTTLYGMAGQLTLIGLHDLTTARVDVYSGTAPFPLSSGSGAAGGVTNPMTLFAGQTQVIPVAENDALVRVVSDKPLVAYGNPVGLASGDPPNGGIVGPIPSTNGGLLGTEFIVPDRTLAVVAVTPGPAARVNYGPTSNSFSQISGQVSLTGGAPSALIPLVGADAVPSQFPTFMRIASTEPILLLSYNFDNGKAQYPTPWGAPAGSRVVALPITGDRCGMGTEPARGEGPNCEPNPHPPCTDGTIQADPVRSGSALVTSLTPDTFVRGRDHITGALRFPQESQGKAADLALPLSPGASRIEAFRPTVTGARTAYACPMLFHAVKTASDTAVSEGADLVVYAGGLNNALGAPQGSPTGKDFWTYWSSSVVAHHNGTQVIVTQPGKPELRRTLGKGDALDVAGTINNPAHVQSTKPVVLLARSEPSGATRVGGARGWFAGFDDSLVVTPAGLPQYRGYLVSLEPATVSTEPMQGLAAPGKASTYKLLVKNLAKDDRGNPVPDTVQLAVDPPADGWTAELSATTLRLQGGESAEVTLRVAPPADAREGAKSRVLVTAASEGNPRMMDRIQTITTIRASYEVGVWFDREGSPPGKTLTLDPAETKDVRIVVKNLATVPDRVTVRATLGSADWRTRWDGSPSPLLDLALEPGESRTLTLKLTAPEAKASQTTLTVLATSVSDASAGAKQDATARVRADVRIALLANETVVEAPPGTRARMQVAFENRGNDRVGIKFNTTGALPDGWPRPVVLQGPYEIDELTGIEPGSRVVMDVHLDVPADALRGDRANVHFFVETVPQFAGDQVLRESVDLLVLTGARHALTPVDPSFTIPLGLEEAVRASLTLANAGNGIESLRVVPRDVPQDATVEVGGLTAIPVGESGTVEVTVAFPSFIPAGTYHVAADVLSDDGHAVPWEFNVSVPERRAASLHPLGALQGIAGVPTQVRVEVANEGNVELTMPPAILVPLGWKASWSGEAGILPSGASRILTLRLEAPADAAPQVYELTPEPGWAQATPLSWDLRTVALRAEATRDGDSVNVRLHNDGTGDALQVDLVLLQDGVEVDKVTLQRVAAGDSTPAILAPRDGGDGDLVVLVDNAKRYSEEAQRAEVRGATTVNGAPGPAPFLVVAVGVAVALALRRRG